VARKSKIDWASIKIRVVHADKDHPNDGNPYAKLSPKERESHCVRKRQDMDPAYPGKGIRGKSGGHRVVPFQPELQSLNQPCLALRFLPEPVKLG